MDTAPVQQFMLRFDVSGIGGRTVERAALQLHNTNSATRGGEIHAVSNDSWQEETLTWANAPAAEGGLVASVGAVSSGNDYEIALSPAAIDGDGVYGFRVVGASTDGATYSSKEAAAAPPRLVISLDEAP